MQSNNWITTVYYEAAAKRQLKRHRALMRDDMHH
eukprot:CAMPEP_0184386946 /NCGR_PEP_ID=MMETSP0007-20130409/10278_1 /TAXON_ID=97485 /ORGANISM="Prymnesium parvum, Strain Texoma1" /LENGTH=33 /DNA_ID= /DNA_START= /DNA_END= /DNA_ORIENTATION=